jgi:cell division protease FtsH
MSRDATRKRLEVALASMLVLVALLMGGDLLLNASQKTLSYSEFKAEVKSGHIKEAVIGSHTLTGTLVDGTRYQAQRIPGDDDLLPALESAGVRFDGPAPWRAALYRGVAPTLAVLGLLYVLFHSLQTPLSKFGKRGRSLLVAESPSVGFDRVAGCDEAKDELAEIVDFLTAPEKFLAMGASMPRGVLLTGPPGTGKTLLARALAAEAGVPFFSLSGSDFVEMYVGVGAARVRDLFEQARKHSPCIVFIDEIDALGKSRDQAGANQNDEREQTLNQLLVELDGFDGDSQVVLIGATNRPNVIDPALLRPGRFDRQGVVDAPDRVGRLAILQVHSRGKRIGPSVSMQKLANATAGMSGADLANVLNEAALLAARKNATSIEQEHLQEAMEKVVAGPVRATRLLDAKLKERIAYHEVGHALMAFHSPTAHPVHKISIVPRGKSALGYMMQLPPDDIYLMTQTELRDKIRVLLGGRAAEALIFGEVSTGAENDLERCSLWARRMIGNYGMGDATGLLHVGADLQSCSPEFGARVDEAARDLLGEIFKEAQAILAENRHQLDTVARRLIKTEVMESDEFEELLQQTEPNLDPSPFMALDSSAEPSTSKPAPDPVAALASGAAGPTGGAGNGKQPTPQAT